MYESYLLERCRLFSISIWSPSVYITLPLLPLDVIVIFYTRTKWASRAPAQVLTKQRAAFVRTFEHILTWKANGKTGLPGLKRLFKHEAHGQVKSCLPWTKTRENNIDQTQKRSKLSVADTYRRSRRTGITVCNGHRRRVSSRHGKQMIDFSPPPLLLSPTLAPDISVRGNGFFMTTVTVTNHRHCHHDQCGAESCKA